MKKIYGISIAILGLVILAGAFYWFEWRPKEIRTFCGKKSIDLVKETTSLEIKDLDEVYLSCVRAKGLPE